MRNKQEEKMLTCVKCGHVVTVEINGGSGSSKAVEPISTYNYSEDTLKVLDSEKSVEALPTTNIECPKCFNNSAYWWMLQTRSADEATTQFYRCTACNHTWRNYS